MVPIQLTALLLAATGTGETVLYDFQAAWCGPCKMMAPVVQQLSAEGYPVRKIDVDQEAALAQRFGVTNIPCFVLVVDGKERGRIIGATSHQRLSGLLTTAGVLPNGAHAFNARGQSPDRPRKLLPLAGTLFSKRSRDETPPVDLDVPQVKLGQVAKSNEQHSTAASMPSPPAAAPQSFAETNPVQPHPAVQTERLLQASVRLRVYDPQGHSLGSGTIIDSRVQASGVSDALVLTCGHIFRDSAGNGKIEVDVFDRGMAKTVVGKLVRYDLQNDIGFVSIRSDLPLSAIFLATEQNIPAVGDAVLSIGCDHGSDPTVQQSTIKAINSFVGPPNLQVDGQPAVGRSGGGLFNQRGELIGICNFADPTDRAGLYGAVQLAHTMLREINPQVQQEHQAPAVLPTDMPQNLVALAAANRSPGSAQELICIVRTGSGSESRHQVIVIDNASKALLDRITAEHSQKGQPFPTSMAVDGPQAPIRSPHRVSP